MLKKILRELGIFCFFIFLFLFILGIFVPQSHNRIFLASSYLPDIFLLHLSQSIGAYFFLLMGKSSYFMILVFFPLLLSILFKKWSFLLLAYRVMLIIVYSTLLSGLFSPSEDWLEGGLIGGLIYTLVSGFVSSLIVGLIFSSIILYQIYCILEWLFHIKISDSIRDFFIKKTPELTQEAKKLKENTMYLTQTLPMVIHDIIVKEEWTKEQIESLLLTLEKEEVKNNLWEIYSHISNPDEFGKLLLKFMRNLYQTHNITSFIETQDIKDPKESLFVIQENQIASVSPPIIELSDYALVEQESQEQKVDNSIKSLENMQKDASEFLIEQLLIQEKLEDIFMSFNSSHSIPQETLNEAQSKFVDKSESTYNNIKFHDQQKDYQMSKEEMESLETLALLRDMYDAEENIYTRNEKPENIKYDINQVYLDIKNEVDSEIKEFQDIAERDIYESLGRDFIEDPEIDEKLQEDKDIDPIIEDDIAPKKQIQLDSNHSESQASFNHLDNHQKDFILPPLSLLRNSESPEVNEEDKDFIGDQIISILKEFNINSELDKIIVGPVVTRYEIKPPKGLKVNRITELNDNIALGLASKDKIRIEAPVFGKSVVGIEVPNMHRELVTFKDLADIFGPYHVSEYQIPFLMGKQLDGNIVIRDLVKMPHLLIAGSTGSGKSVCVNTLINSILYYKTPEEVRLLLVDPKRVELILYDNLPHLVAPVIKETPEAIKALKWLVNHMEERYILLEEKQVRNISEYNHIKKNEGLPIMPYIVVIMDEFADLILLGKRDVEESVIRLAAMARAVGIHLVLATQRPSADVITGLIKANFPSRIAFKVSSKMESRIILDENGAENLLGKGDMLFLSADGGAMTQRIQAPFMSDEEVRQISLFFKERYESNYWEEVLEDDAQNTENFGSDLEEEPLFNDAVNLIIKEQKASASYLQRRLKIGYNRAARIIETMEDMGIISRNNGSKPREILVEEWEN